MYYTAELYMDGTSETTIREMQHAIGQRVGRMPPPDVRPHVTLAVGASFPNGLGSARLDDLAKPLLNTPIVFISLGQFVGERWALFLAPVVTGTLLDVQQQVHALMGGTTPPGDDFCAPGRWVPHCTLALGLDPAEALIAISCAAEMSLPVVARVSGIGIKRYASGPGDALSSEPGSTA